MSKNKLSDEVLSLENFKNDINSKFSELNDHFHGFEVKYEMVNSVLDCITHLDCNNLSNAQYNRKETLEINAVSSI